MKAKAVKILRYIGRTVAVLLRILGQKLRVCRCKRNDEESGSDT